MNRLISRKNCVFISLVGPSDTGKSQFIYNWLNIGTFQPKIWQILLFLSTLSDTLWCNAKRDWKSRVGSRCKLWIYRIVDKKRYKILVNLWRFMWRDLQHKSICWYCHAGRQRELNTIYIKHNLFYQSKPGRDVELQNTHIVLFKSPHEVMQDSTLSVQLALRSELVDWYTDATSVPYGHLLIDLPPRTDDRLRYSTLSGSIPSNFYIPDRLKQSKILNDEVTKSLYSPSVPIIFPQNQKSFPSVLPKRVYPVSLRMHNKSAQRKAAKHKKTSRGKISQRRSTIVSETYNMEAKKRHSGVRKRLTPL